MYIRPHIVTKIRIFSQEMFSCSILITHRLQAIHQQVSPEMMLVAGQCVCVFCDYVHVHPLSGQLVVCTLCSCVMQTKRIWLFSAHLLPLVARLCLVPLETIVFINKFSMIFTGLEVIYFLASNLLVPYNLAKTAYRELAQVINY